MPVLKFEKWFTDVLTPERDYLIIFHTLLELIGIRIFFVEINFARFGEDHVFHLNRKQKLIRRSGHSVSTVRGDLKYEDNQAKIRLSHKEMEIELNMKPVSLTGIHKKGMKISNRTGGTLEWKIIYLKTKVSGSIRIAREGKESLEEKINGTGYSDYLHSNMSPFRVPVHQLYWGRLHSGDLDLSYSLAMDVHENVSGALMWVHYGKQALWFENISVFPEQWKEFNPPGISCPVSYRMSAVSRGMKLSLVVMHLKPAIVSEFTENPKELGPFRQALLRHLIRGPKGIKFYSKARLEMEIEGRTVQMDEIFFIDEYVRFRK